MLERLKTFTITPEDLRFRDNEELRDFLYALEGVEVSSVGPSRDANEMFGLRFGHGPRNVSVIGGCHADEPAGPMTAQLLARSIQRDFPELLDAFRFRVMPQMNPDGADRNRVWFADPPELSGYLNCAMRELPGDDIEFGFGEGRVVRPECRAMQKFLDPDGPYVAHFSLHGMAFSEGMWCLVCKERADDSAMFMDSLTDLCAKLHFPLHDIDRKGEKGFTRLREGFCTTPHSVPMREHFLALDDKETAGKFLPTSMEWVQSCGGDPLCIVSELPLFHIGVRSEDIENPISMKLKEDIGRLRAKGGEVDAEGAREISQKYDLRPLAMEFQVRLQTGIIVLALESILKQEDS